MNAFDLKAALLTKHAQHAVINPRTHGVKHGSNAWLTNSKLLAFRVCARGGAISFLPALCYFLTTIRNISRGFQSRDIHAGVLAFLETTN
jgi:hypothetical protein